MADLALLLLTLLWGTSFHLVKVVLDVASPGVFLAARFGAAALALGLVWAVRRDPAGPRLWRDGGLLGLFALAGFVLQTVGLRHTTPARSGFLTGLSVLVVPFVARFALGRAVRAASWAGVALATVGLALLTRPFDGGIGAAVRLGDALTVGCAVAYALMIVFTSEWSPRHALTPLVFAEVAVVLVGSVLLVPLETPRLDAARLPELGATVLFTGLVLTAGAFYVMAWAQRRVTAVRAALIFALEPVSAALFSNLYGGEVLVLADWAGGALVVLGVVVGEVGGALEARAGAAGG
jgi:drug/metabolite transporter (DMT)-like permease